MKIKLEYIWLDGVKPEATLRSKTRILNLDTIPKPQDLPEWSFDGSSTKQAVGDKSDCILKPVRVYEDPQRTNAYLVLCEVFNADGTPHETNERHKLFELDKQESISKEDWWFGFEQEYVLMKDGVPLGFPKEGYPEPQGKYYCGVGNRRVIGREIIEEHLDACISIGLDITGINGVFTLICRQ